jgi:hypothetical protein
LSATVTPSFPAAAIAKIVIREIFNLAVITIAFSFIIIIIIFVRQILWRTQRVGELNKAALSGLQSAKEQRRGQIRLAEEFGTR